MITGEGGRMPAASFGVIWELFASGNG